MKMKFKKEQLALYGVTDPSWTGKYTLKEQIIQALEGGVTMLQLREKHMPEAEFIREAREVREICSRYQVPLIINDNLEVAIQSGADGIHVGLEDLPVREIREKMGSDFIIGATAKTVEQAEDARNQGADYLGVGAIFPSPTKKTAIRITGQQLESIVKAAAIPCVAIGGITIENMGELSGSGVDGVAVVSAIFGAEDIPEACRRLKEKSRQVRAGA